MRKLPVAVKSVVALMLLFLACYGSRFPQRVKVVVAVAAALSVAWNIRHDCRRMRPRGRMRMATALFGGLAIAFALMIVAGLEDREPGWEWMAGGFAVLCAACIAGGIWSFVRMRRLCAQARQRLWELHTMRRRRATVAGREIYG